MIQASSTTDTQQRLLLAVGLAITAIVVGGAEILVTRTTFDIWGGVSTAIVVFVITVPFLIATARREQDRHILPILVAALIAKLLAGFVYYFVIGEFYGGVADAVGYHRDGAEIADHLRAADVGAALAEAGAYWPAQSFSGLTSLIGTPFIPLVAGVVYVVIGTSYLGGFVFFSWLAFIGAYFFYRAFKLTFPTSTNRSYVLMLFFLPSMLFWSSTIGKDAWMMLSLGLSAFGAARFLESKAAIGILPLGAGIVMMAAVRIHLAAMVGAAVVISYMLRRQSSTLRELAPLAKGFTLGLLLLGGSVIALRGQEYLVAHGLDPRSGIGAALVEVSDRTGEAGSDFSAAIVRSPLDIPIATWTVLFRPHPLEVTDALGALAAVEGSLLLGYAIFRLRRFVWVVKSLRAKPYVALCLTFTLLFIVAFSSYANFGLLLRQRIQVIPFLLVLISFQKNDDVPPHRPNDAANPPRRRSTCRVR